MSIFTNIDKMFKIKIPVLISSVNFVIFGIILGKPNRNKLKYNKKTIEIDKLRLILSTEKKKDFKTFSGQNESLKNLSILIPRSPSKLIYYNFHAPRDDCY
ncbi:hypothetical protein BpHYR1_051406 [Brachionus plicatilis]|uniref:Uncharacterized protein n=1 Tax=Brachionus plicatilis TaxID=10195 RepID=A0A3M7S220_BRAPC|nr:hypothetical protein BpHYR1_051406 [Brachionus plicatilis]